MKKNMFWSLFLILSATAFMACNTSTNEGGDEPNAQEESKVQATEVASSEEATEFDQKQEAFHTFMAATFHPAEEDNLAPLREQHADMATAAKELAQTDIPAKYADKNLNQQLSNLVAGTKEISQMVEDGAEDAELKQAIFDLHGVFHDIMGACQDAENHGMHEKHHADGEEHHADGEEHHKHKKDMH